MEKKVSIKKYLKYYNDPKYIESILQDIESKVNDLHKENKIVEDFNTENIYIDDLGELNFSKIKAETNLEEIKKENLKYLILLIASFTNNTENPSVKNKLKENSDVSIQDVAKFYFKTQDNLPEFVTNKIRSKKTSSSMDHGKKKVLGNGKYKADESENNELDYDNQINQYKPNAFITLVLFPFLIFYIVFMVALVYWMVVLK